MAGTTQTLKASLVSRVSPGQVSRLSSQRQNLGEGLMCPAGAGDLQNDVYGRPVSQNTLLLDDASCSNYTIFPAARRIQVENNERPYLPICAAGLRGAGDFMGVARDVLPQNIYGTGNQGNMIRHYPTPNNAQWDQGPHLPRVPFYQKKIQPFSYSMDGSLFAYRG